MWLPFLGEEGARRYPFIKNGNWLRLRDFYDYTDEAGLNEGFTRHVFHRLVHFFSPKIGAFIEEFRAPTEYRGDFSKAYRYASALGSTAISLQSLHDTYQNLCATSARQHDSCGKVHIPNFSPGSKSRRLLGLVLYDGAEG